MLPPVLLSTYRQYKRDTNYIASWLAATAKARGYPLDSASSNHVGDEEGTPSGRLKGKARKEAKETASKATATKYIVPIKDFIPMAKWIVSQKPAIKVPDTLSSALNKVIELRSAFTTHMQLVERNPEKDETHSYFVGILKTVRSSLQGLMSRTASEAFATAANSPTALPATENKLENIFAALNIYEPTESDLEPRVAPESISATGVKVEYEAEQQTDEAGSLLIYHLLFMDLDKIRQQIRLIWANVKTNGFDTAAAALATNTAIDLARSLMDDAITDLNGRDINEICKKFYILLCNYLGYDHDEKQIYYEMADFTYYNALTLLELSLQQYKGGKCYFPPPPITAGLYTPARDSSQADLTTQYKDDADIINDIYTDCTSVAFEGYPLEDELLRGMKEALQDKDTHHKPPFYLVFATQILLDIHHDLKEKTEAIFDLTIDQMKAIAKMMENHIALHDQSGPPAWSKSTNDKELSIKEQLTNLGQDVLEMVNDHIYNDKIKSYRVVDGRPIRMERRPNQILRLSPVISGLMLYRFRYLAMFWGMQAANHTISIVTAWHLYNALRNEEMVQAWNDMDAVYAMLQPSDLHAGEKPPTKDYHKPYGLRIGIKPSTFHPNNLKKLARIGAGPRFKALFNFIDPLGPPVSKLFAPRFVDGKQKLDWKPEDVEQILSYSTWKAEGSLESGNLSMEQLSRKDQIQAAKARKRQRHLGNLNNKKLAADQLIGSLAMALNAEAMDIAFPWLAVETHCWRLLREVRLVSQKELKDFRVPESSVELGECMEFTMFGLLAEITTDNRKPFEQAAKAMNAFIEQNDNTILGGVILSIPITTELNPAVGYLPRATDTTSRMPRTFSANPCKMKFSTLTAVILATIGVTFASPVPGPDPEPAPAPGNATELAARAGWTCYLANGTGGEGSIPCRSGANTGYSVVTYYAVGWEVDVYCKANGGTYKGSNVWDYIDRGGNNCWINAYHTHTGCENPVRWC
ncbi:hypothetical protein V8F20_009406 [Naviculisporaceae sp. PSN 640]